MSAAVTLGPAAMAAPALRSAPNPNRRSIPLSCPATSVRRFMNYRLMVTEVEATAPNRPLLSRPFRDILIDVEPNLFASRTSPRAGSEHKRAPKAENTQLWAEKYAPTRFVELLGDSRTNRNLLRWLKDWRGFAASGDAVERPEHQLVLLAGPPGTGKSTTARVLANIAGFTPINLYASDGHSLRDRMRELLSVQSIKFIPDDSASGLPCLIFDDFDACETHELANTVDTIISVVTSTKSRGRGMFPVVVICNDLFARPLRRVRQNALVFSHCQPNANDIRARLKDIVRLEGHGTGTEDAIDSVCEGVGSDIRSSLNTVQFLCLSRTEFNENPSHFCCSKDSSASAFELWDMIFSQTQPKNRLPDSRNASENLRERLHSSDSRHVLDGCYENALAIASRHDRGLYPVSKALTFHSLCDSIPQSLAHLYVEPCILRYRFFLAARNHKRTKFVLPNRGTGNRSIMTRIRNEIDLFRRQVVRTLANSVGTSVRSCIQCIVPFLVLTLLPQYQVPEVPEGACSREAALAASVLRGIANRRKRYGLKKGARTLCEGAYHQVCDPVDPDIVGAVSFTAGSEQPNEREPLLVERRPLPDDSHWAIIDVGPQALDETERLPTVDDAGQSVVQIVPRKPRLPDSVKSKVRTRFRFNEGRTMAVRRPLYVADLG